MSEIMQFFNFTSTQSKSSTHLNSFEIPSIRLKTKYTLEKKP